MFKIVNGANGEPFVHKTPTASETFLRGEILKLTDNKLTKADPTSAGVQLYLCQEAYVAPASGAKEIAVTPISADMLFEVGCTGQIADSAVDSAKVTLHTDALQVTTTTTNGVFLVVDTDGAATSTVKGYFR